eukprot:TRINITY_DN1703_c0_g1_i2.p2 TRINITY_DN1703_c0_g1~~TRINITY_DN1703_c0_g1_i2.p2  ORF type:complete len:137 (+),score=8.53 TRINITY_DN1703_c0_g1_i2:208-618(+)
MGKLHKKVVSGEWFHLLRSGVKTIEGRLNCEPFSKMQVGDRIRFSGTEQYASESFDCTIVRLAPYESFAAMLEREGLAAVVPVARVQTIADGVAEYRHYFTEEQEGKHGVLAIEICLPSLAGKPQMCHVNVWTRKI